MRWHQVRTSDALRDHQLFSTDCRHLVRWLIEIHERFQGHHAGSQADLFVIYFNNLESFRHSLGTEIYKTLGASKCANAPTARTWPHPFRPRNTCLADVPYSAGKLALLRGNLRGTPASNMPRQIGPLRPRASLRASRHGPARYRYH
jgi:hypothetical protein